MSDTIRVMNLWKIKSAPVRRTVIVLTFAPLMAANVVFAVIGLLLFGWRNQRELFRSAAHYWRTDERITDTSNQSYTPKLGHNSEISMFYDTTSTGEVL